MLNSCRAECVSTRRSQLPFVLAKHLLKEAGRFVPFLNEFYIGYFNKVMSVIMVLAVDVWIEPIWPTAYTAIYG